MKKVLVSVSMIVLFAVIGLSSTAKADELVDIDTSQLGTNGSLQIDNVMIDSGVEYYQDDKVYNVEPDGTLSFARYNINPSLVISPRTDVTLRNGESYTRSWSVGAVRVSFMCGRTDHGVASRTQYIYDSNSGQYVYYDSMDCARGGISMKMPRTSYYTFGLISHQQYSTKYYFNVSF